MTRHYEDVTVGMPLAGLVKGPLGPVHLMRWSAAMENWHRIHYDRAFAVDHDGLPERLIHGSLKQQFILQMLKDWAGPDGWVWRVAFQFRGMNRVGETLQVWGRVLDKRLASTFGVIDVALGIVNETGVESSPGTALVVLPLRDGPPVPYPFVPPAA